MPRYFASGVPLFLANGELNPKVGRTIKAHPKPTSDDFNFEVFPAVETIQLGGEDHVFHAKCAFDDLNKLDDASYVRLNWTVDGSVEFSSWTSDGLTLSSVLRVDQKTVSLSKGRTEVVCHAYVKFGGAKEQHWKRGFALTFSSSKPIVLRVADPSLNEVVAIWIVFGATLACLLVDCYRWGEFMGFFAILQDDR